MKLSELRGFPRLNKLLVYNEFEIAAVGGGLRGDTGWYEGYMTEYGKFLRHGADGVPTRQGDRTVASLLANLHVAVTENFRGFNRFFSYADESDPDLSAEEYQKRVTVWMDDQKYVGDASASFVTDRKRE
jgi:hypothetical protein